MNRYALVQEGQIVQGPVPLPKNWGNISGLNKLDNNALKSLGWLPWRFVEIQAEVLTGSTVEILEDEVVETQTGRNKTPEEIAAEQEEWRRSTSVTPLQIRRALLRQGLLDEVTAFVEAADLETRMAWEYAVQIDRMNELIAAAATSIGATDEDVDNLFRLAATL